MTQPDTSPWYAPDEEKSSRHSMNESNAFQPRKQETQTAFPKNLYNTIIVSAVFDIYWHLPTLPPPTKVLPLTGKGTRSPSIPFV